MAAIFTGFISRFNELGLSAALIQRKNIDEMHLSNIILVKSGYRGDPLHPDHNCFTIYAEYFQEELVRPILIVSSINFIVGSFTVIPEHYLPKILNSRKLAIVEIWATFYFRTDFYSF